MKRTDLYALFAMLLVAPRVPDLVALGASAIFIGLFVFKPHDEENE